MAICLFFKIVLHLGNFLNGGTAKGAALGFKLVTLTKLCDTKTMDNKSSLLHYLVKLMQKDKDDDLMSVSEELQHVVAARRGKLCYLEIARFGICCIQLSQFQCRRSKKKSPN